MFDTDRMIFALMSFEGPDVYAQAGGLGVRMKELSRALAERGFETHLFFIGDPELPGEEQLMDGRLTLHRWSQWLSRAHPVGVYSGEEEKVKDVNRSLPSSVSKEIVAKAAAAGKTTVVLGEEWQMARAMTILSERLTFDGLRRRSLLLWNANNHFGFERLDWAALRRTTTVTTVSRYMKQIMQRWGADALVIPNGIPGSMIGRVGANDAAALRSAADRPFLFKIGRFTPDKRWLQAVEAVAGLNANGAPVHLLMRGGIEPHGGEIRQRAAALGLRVQAITEAIPDVSALSQVMRQYAAADLWDIRSFLPDSLLPPIYAAATATVANSGHEPFGLVGLEAMASGGIAFVGASGEDYAEPFRNAIVVDTDDPAEVTAAVRGLLQDPEADQRMRIAAQRTAHEFTWQRVIDVLLRRLEYVALRQALEV
jgi:glycosyltransferase involved in cell wall biosynthesis